MIGENNFLENTQTTKHVHKNISDQNTKSKEETTSKALARLCKKIKNAKGKQKRLSDKHLVGMNFFCHNKGKITRIFTFYLDL